MNHAYLYLAIIGFWVIFFSIFRILNAWFFKVVLEKHTLFQVFIFALSFSVLGLTLGFFIGYSTASIVGLVIPALLSFIAGFLAYFFNIEKSMKNPDEGVEIFKILIPIAIISFSISTWLGAEPAAKTRLKTEELRKDKDHYRNLETIELEYLLKMELAVIEKGDTSWHLFGHYEKVLDRYRDPEQQINFEELKREFTPNE